MQRDLLDDVLRDLLAWDAGGAIDAERERDTFAPSTLAHLRAVYSGEGLDDEVQRLVALAQTPTWSPFHAAQLYARLRELTLDDMETWSGDLAEREERRKQAKRKADAVRAANAKRAEEARAHWLGRYDDARRRNRDHDEAVHFAAGIGGDYESRRSRIRAWLADRDGQK